MEEETFEQKIKNLEYALKCAEIELATPSELKTDEQRNQFQFYYLGLQYAYTMFTGNIWEETIKVTEDNTEVEETSSSLDNIIQEVVTEEIELTLDTSMEEPLNDEEISFDVEDKDITYYSQDQIFAEVLGQYILTYHNSEFVRFIINYLNTYNNAEKEEDRKGTDAIEA